MLKGYDMSFLFRNEKKRIILKHIVREFGMMVVMFCLVYILSQTIWLFAVIPTGSMEPTITPPTWVFSLRISYWFESPQRGDVVLLRRDNGEETIYAKRVIGEPGDTIEIRSGVTYVNGNELPEEYLTETPEDIDFGPFAVPENSYFLMGDNRNNSLDSRFWEEHFVPEQKILSKVILGIGKTTGVIR